MANKDAGNGVVRGRRSSVADLHVDESDILNISDIMGDAGWYAKDRMEAFNVYKDTPMPSLDDEAWRRTDISGVDWEKFSKAIRLSLIHI